MKRTRENLIGLKFNRLEIIDAYRNKGCVRVICKCDCGKVKDILYASVSKGLTKSCGCLRNFMVKKACCTHGMSKTRLHKEWRGIKHRIKNPSATDFEYYGGKNISMCDEWFNSFESFFIWAMQNGYDDGLTIDRIDNSKGYCPENCRWVTHKKNCRNRGKFRTNTSGYTGVTLDKKTELWRANIMVDGKNVYLGRHKRIEDAAKVRKEAEQIYWGG